jgi:hypothetical protein
MPLPVREFPQDLTEEEKKLGFDLIELENPSNSRSDFRFRLAVVFLVNETDVIFKNRDPFTRSIFYQQMRWGTLPEEGERVEAAEWHCVSNRFDRDPVEAIQQASANPNGDLLNSIVARPFAMRRKSNGHS